MTIVFYKPFQVLSQFTREEEHHKCLADFLTVPSNVYPVGRLDYDSEGLLLLSDDTGLNKKLLDPSHHISKTYYVQVEGAIDQKAITQLQNGVSITLPNKKKYLTLPCTVAKLETPDLPERNPPIRYRAHIPVSWISITLHEGKNRQVRKMCAAAGFPVLRLVRATFGEYTLDGLQPGDYKVLD